MYFSFLPVSKCEKKLFPNGDYTPVQAYYRRSEYIHFKCNADYNLVGSDELICLEGDWSAPWPSCERKFHFVKGWLGGCIFPLCPELHFSKNWACYVHVTKLPITLWKMPLNIFYHLSSQIFLKSLNICGKFWCATYWGSNLLRHLFLFIVQYTAVKLLYWNLWKLGLPLINKHMCWFLVPYLIYLLST